MGRGGGILRERADWVRLVELLYAPTTEDVAWGGAIADALPSIFRRADGAGLYVYTQDGGVESLRRPLAVERGIAVSSGATPEAIAAFDSPELFDLFFNPPALANTHAEMEPLLSPPNRNLLAGMRAALGMTEVVGLVGKPQPGVTVVAAVAVDEKTALSKHQRRLLSQLVFHLETSYRLRKRPSDVRAIVRPDGSVVQREDDAPDVTRLGVEVRRIDSARARAARREPSAIDLWRALVDGEASVVEQDDGGTRQYLVLANAPSQRRHRALTRREIEVVRMAARGVPTKLVAYGLGISPATVSSALARAAAKLGLRSRLALVRIASLLVDTAQAPVDPRTLTETEREVFELVRGGLSNEEIARRRGRSPRTVANQVAAILRKTEQPSRRAIVSAKTAEPEGLR